jgi:hypothetical protein
MKLVDAIAQEYGVKLAPIMREFRMTYFDIDERRIGFAFPVGRYGFFGCRADGKAWTAEQSGVFDVEIGKLWSKERLIWEIGCGMVERGEEMSEADWDRFLRAREELA